MDLEWNLIVTKRISRTNGRRKHLRDIFWRLLEGILKQESQLTISEWNYLFFFLLLMLQGKKCNLVLYGMEWKWCGSLQGIGMHNVNCYL